MDGNEFKEMDQTSATEKLMFDVLDADVRAADPKKKAEDDEPFWHYLVMLAAVVLIAFLIVKFVAVRSVVDGSSMETTLTDQDNLILEKLSYYFHDPERFDVIVFELKNDPDTHYIKRIIGLPGETVQIKDGFVYINDELLMGDTYCEETINYGYTAVNPITLGPDEYFVMGDNRNHSKDSRSAEVGPIKRSQFIGKAWVRFWPIWKAKVVK